MQTFYYPRNARSAPLDRKVKVDISEGQFNTIIYNDNDVYRSQTSRKIVLMNPVDMQREGFVEGDLVSLLNDTGKMAGLQVKPFAIRQGNLMTYFPEANVLIPLTSDPRSLTPAFKAVHVKIEAEALNGSS